MVLGEVCGHEVMCPLHGARFDLRTGRHLSLPAVRPVASYPVKVEGGRILIEIS
jgi:3-phenylpropionate/trans-cinnamate dioxygenase ferredoxin subunit